MLVSLTSFICLYLCSYFVSILGFVFHPQTKRNYADLEIRALILMAVK